MAPRPARSVLLAVPLVLAFGLGTAATASQPAPEAPAARSGAADTADDLPHGAVVADEQIYQLARSGDRIYAYGNFSTVGRYAGPGAVLDIENGAPSTSPKISDGQVSVAVNDGSGGWYLGGDFTRIGGHPAGGLAHVLADGTLDTSFLPRANHLVSALALFGHTLYVGGSFTSVNGTARQHLAVVSTVDGTVLTYNAPQVGRVTELLFDPALDHTTARLFVGADGLHALDPVTGEPEPGFSASVDTPIHALALGGGRLYVGGATVVALNPATGAADPTFDTGTPMAVDAMRRVHTLLYTADRLYVGGDRTLIGGRPGRLVAVNPATGAIDPGFTPDITTESTLPYVHAGVYDLALDGDRLWAAGSFAGGLTIVDAVSGAAVDTDLPSYNLQANAVELSAGKAYVGGHFYMTDAVHTRGLAALDADTLDPIPGFRANANTYGDLFTGAGAVWIASTNFMGYDPSETAAESGQFFHSWTSTVAAFDPDTGAVIDTRSMQVKDLTGITTIGSRLYVARRLETDQRYPHNRIDVYGPGGTRVDTFLMPLRGYITQLSSLNGDLIAAGSFLRSRSRGGTAILRLNPEDGSRRIFDPMIDGPVYSVAPQGGTLYAAGMFHNAYNAYRHSRRPGLSKMDGFGAADVDFVPKGFSGNRVLLQIHPLGDLLWVDGAAGGFFDATTGAGVPNPTGLEFPGWVAGTGGNVAYTSFLMPNLGGRSGFKLGFVAAAH